MVISRNYQSINIFILCIYVLNIFCLFQEYGEFLEERKKTVEEQKKMLQEKREAKMLRTA